MSKNQTSWNIDTNDGQIYRISLIDSIEFSATSHGEINKTDIFDQERLQKENSFIPIEGGLFCERIFGNISDYSCDCGIMGYSITHSEQRKNDNADPEKRLLRAIFGETNPIDTQRILAHHGSNCKICGQPIVPMSQRLKRWGHINLCTPVTHAWFLKNSSSNLSAILGIPVKDLIKIVYFDSYIVTQSKTMSLSKLRILSNPEYEDLKFNMGNNFEAKTGTEALKDLLAEIDLQSLSDEIKNRYIVTSSPKSKKELNNRIEIIEALISSKSKPERMLLKNIPVLPPDLRIIYSTQGGEVIYNTINNDYIEVIIRNNIVKKFIQDELPTVIINLEKKKLQIAVDNLFQSIEDQFEFIDDEYLVQRNRRLGNSPKYQGSNYLWVSFNDFYRENRYKWENKLFDYYVQRLKGLCLNVEEIDQDNVLYPQQEFIEEETFTNSSSKFSKDKDDLFKKVTNRIGMEFVYIPPGTFLMGSQNEHNALQHKVTLTQGFYLQTTPVTQGQWKLMMTAKRDNAFLKFENDDFPINEVSWEQAQKFISKLNRKEKTDRYRLPTEAEWEYAERAGSNKNYSFGNSSKDLDRYAWYKANSGGKLHIVGKLEPNAWGLYDMQGNVSEWCADWYADSCEDYPPDGLIDPVGPSEGINKVLRGGCYFSEASFCRSCDRRNYILSAGGFRIAMNL